MTFVLEISAILILSAILGLLAYYKRKKNVENKTFENKIIAKFQPFQENKVFDLLNKIVLDKGQYLHIYNNQFFTILSDNFYKRIDKLIEIESGSAGKIFIYTNWRPNTIEIIHEQIVLTSHNPRKKAEFQYNNVTEVFMGLSSLQIEYVKNIAQLYNNVYIDKKVDEV